MGRRTVDRMYFYFQSQEEVCDLKHAAPFQNIIPKPYIPLKGGCFTMFYLQNFLWFSLWVSVCMFMATFLFKTELKKFYGDLHQI